MNNKENKDLYKILSSNFFEKSNEEKKDNIKNLDNKISNNNINEHTIKDEKISSHKHDYKYKKLVDNNLLEDDIVINKSDFNEDLNILEEEFNNIKKIVVPGINNDMENTRKYKRRLKEKLNNTSETNIDEEYLVLNNKDENKKDNEYLSKKDNNKKHINKNDEKIINKNDDNMKSIPLNNKVSLSKNNIYNENLDNKKTNNNDELFEFSKRPINSLLTNKNTKSISFWKVAIERIFKQKLTMISVLFIIILVVLSIVVPDISGELSYAQNLDLKNLPPKIPFIEKLGILNGCRNGKDMYSLLNVDTCYFFGTDDLGRDLFSRVWLGMRTSLSLAAIIMFIQTIIGTIIGGISGYFGGIVDGIIQRILEVLGNIPTIIVVLVIALILKASFFTLVISLSLFDWIPFSRLVRAQVISYKNKDFVTAAKSLGANSFYIIKSHLLPNMLSTFIISITMQFPALILSEAYYTFIGVGLPVGVVSLGQLIVENISKFSVYPYQIYIPTIFMSLISLAFNILGNGLRDALDPTLKELN